MTKLLRGNMNKSIAALPAAFLLGPAWGQPDIEGWSEMNRRVVNARQLIGSDVTNGVTPMGMVSDIVLSEEGTEAEYLLFEVPYPTSLWNANDGFVAFDDVVFEQGVGLDLEVKFDEQESLRLPEELEISLEALKGRLVSRILYDPIQFEDGQVLEIGNLLIDRLTGVVTHYVVETNAEAIFGTAPRAVPAVEVELRDDGVREATLAVDELDSVQDFHPALL